MTLPPSPLTVPTPAQPLQPEQHQTPPAPHGSDSEARQKEERLRDTQSQLEQAFGQVRAKEAELQEQTRHHEERIRDMQS
eukprot:CAMPEP_0198560508 /NCGR_PEP_ID=MMETSP1462-20131121/94068_1 /TAXON_ID=1333877 /ORGANISM="Brandtodinium nutriculum, Strain RCC3387" /LENGTH=79 /DNA_ID=CAMNT_0044291375 /DNA_START=62 /DNA_END=298 /DNA_ORIENTATION=+